MSRAIAKYQVGFELFPTTHTHAHTYTMKVTTNLIAIK